VNRVVLGVTFLALGSTVAAQDTTAVSRATAAVCGDARLAQRGVIFGAVDISSDSAPRANVEVTAKWNDSSRTARTDARGIFRFCGVPAGIDITLSATVEGASGAPYPVRLPMTQPVVRADLSLDRVAADATLTGIVMMDSTRVPVVGAEVSLPTLGKTVLADERGAFRITGIPAGEHRVSIRRLGYGALDTRMLFPSGETVTRNVFLSRAVTLDSVRTTALRGGSLEFEENRRLGLGKFLTRADLEKVGHASLSVVLSTLSGLRIETGRNGHAWVATSRHQILPSGQSPRIGDTMDRKLGARPACYANVVVDNVLMYSGRGRDRDEPLFDINTVHSDQIETIEFYADRNQIPAKYLSRSAEECGVIVIRTRQR
jgi:hypothetical protein